MDKILVVEIGRVTTTASLFILNDKLNHDDLQFGGQKIIQTPPNNNINTAIEEVVNEVLSQGGHVDPAYLKALYILVSFPEKWDHDFNELQENLGFIKRPKSFAIMDTSSAIKAFRNPLQYEVGDFLIVDVGGGSTTIYSVLNSSTEQNRTETFTQAFDLGIYDHALYLVAGIGEGDIEKRYGRQWKQFVKLVPNTVEEIALAAELSAQAVKEALIRHLDNINRRSLSKRRNLKVNWIIGPGRALVELPNGMQALREGLEYVMKMGHPLSIADVPILMDREGLIPALGVFAQDYPEGCWELLLESLSVDS